jgi:flagellar basal-body rod modification protein FlgD
MSMDASLYSTLQAQQTAAAHTVGTSLLPKSGTRSGMMHATGLASGTPIAQATAAPADTGSTTSTSSSSSAASATAAGATITSSDFLTLLVSELQNQDPTQPTDPNEYISQLVGVNSLEQLIQINSGITSLDSAATAASGSGGSSSGSGSLVPALPGTLAGAQVEHAKQTGGTSFS